MALGCQSHPKVILLLGYFSCQLLFVGIILQPGDDELPHTRCHVLEIVQSISVVKKRICKWSSEDFPMKNMPLISDQPK
jgi:hypothetical protein